MHWSCELSVADLMSGTPEMSVPVICNECVWSLNCACSRCCVRVVCKVGMLSVKCACCL